jgi:hypothetical protein
MMTDVTPLQAYRSAERYIAATCTMDPGKLATTSNSQMRNLIELLGKIHIDIGSGTELIEALNSPSANFSLEQRQTLLRTISSIVDGEHTAASSISISRSPEQNCPTIYDYYPAKIWAVARNPDETLKNKFRCIATWHVEGMGLRNPNAATKRLVVALVHAAMGSDPDPDVAYRDVHEFGAIQKQMRELMPGSQTMLSFPKDPVQFRQLHPAAYPEGSPPIPCPIPVELILARARKDLIPLRNTNRQLRGKQSPLARQPNVSPAERLMEGLLNYMSGRGEFPRQQMGVGGEIPIVFNDNPRRRPPTIDQSTGALVPFDQSMGDEDRESPGDRPMPGCLQHHHGDLRSLKLAVQHDMLTGRASTGRAAAAPEHEDRDAELGGEDIDIDAAEAGGGIRKRPATAANIYKRPSAAVAPDDLDTSGTTSKHPTSTAAPSTCFTKTKVAMKLKAAKGSKKVKGATGKPAAGGYGSKGKPLISNPTVARVLAAKQSIHKYPEVVKTLMALKSKYRPAPSKSATSYKGGKIYYIPKSMHLRVLARKGDRHEQRIPIDFDAKHELQAQWGLACAVIESDPRPRDE